MIGFVPLLPLVMAVPALAQPAGAPEIVVTASRVAVPADQSPYSVAVIPEPRIVGRESVADALSDIADIYVQAPAGRAGQAAIFLRGADPNFTAVLLDGVPLNNTANALAGAVNVSEIASAGIERIEVVAGPLSSLYGSGALAGVVNLVVPGGAAEHALEARAGVGTFENYTGFARWRGPLAKSLGGSLALTYDNAGDAAPSSSFQSASVIGKIAPLEATNGGRAIFSIVGTRSRAFPEASGGPRFAVIRDREVRESREGLVGVSRPFRLGPSVRLDLSGSFLSRRDRTSNPGVAPSQSSPGGVPGGVDDTRYRRAIAQGALRYDGGKWQAVAGIESQKEVARSEGELSFFGMRLPSGFRGDRWTHSGFVEASRTASDWNVNAGARVDRVENMGTHITGRLGIRYLVPGSGLSLRASAGTGFKAPSFYALGNPFVGNPALTPERSRAVEAGVQWASADGASLSLAAFHTRYAGLIDFVPDPFPHLENRAVVISKGVSAAAARSFGNRFSASVQMQYSDTRDRDSGERLFNRPRWRSSSLVAWTPAAALTIVGRHRFVGARRAFSVPTGVVTISDYNAVSLEAAWAIGPGTMLRLIVDNALDGDNEDAVGFAAPGRSARVSVEKRI